MQTGNAQIFDSNAGLTGAWIKIGDYGSWSLDVTGLEAGGTLAIALSNANPTTAPLELNGEAGGGLNMNTPKSGVNGFIVTSITSTTTTAFYFGTGVAQWIRIVKTAGGGATQTIVRLFGQL